MTATVSPTWTTGTAVDRYVIEARIGQGGMGEVFRVRHRQLGTVHALKLLIIPSKGIRRRFLREARMQARLRHPNIVAVYDVLEVGEWPALVMEYIAGPTMRDLLAGEPLELAQVDALAEGMFAGVAAVHRAGMIHRDLKPENILLRPVGDGYLPMVADFGLAKVAGGARHTRTNVTMGTPGYMPPEQIRDVASVGAAADVFALGAILYEMITGTAAFERGNVLDTFKAVDSGEHVPVVALRPEVPDRMARAIALAMRVDARERPQSIEALRELWRGEPGAVSAAGPVDLGALSLPSKSTGATATTPASLFDAPAPRVAWLVAAAGAAMMIGVAALGLATWLITRPTPVAEVPQPAVAGDRGAPNAPPAAAEPVPEPAVAREPVQAAPIVTPVHEPPPSTAPAPRPQVAVAAPPPPAEEPAPAADPAEPEPAVAEVAPEPPSTEGWVEIVGDQVGVWLRSPHGAFEPGRVPPGRYVLTLVGGSLEPVDAGELTIRAGDRVTLSCSRLEGRCERMP